MKQIKAAPRRFMRRRQSNLRRAFSPETPEIFGPCSSLPPPQSHFAQQCTDSRHPPEGSVVSSCASSCAAAGTGAVASCSSLSQRARDFFPLQMFVVAKLNLALLFEISFEETAVINGQSQPFGRRWQQLTPLWLLKMAHRRAGPS